MSTAIDPHRCPLCGGVNQCAVANGRSACWCFNRTIPDEVLEKIPAEAHQLACVCQACAFGTRDPTATLARMREILRKRG